MRKIIIMRGLPGSGKSTWIKQHELEDYTLSPDNIRQIVGNPVMRIDIPYFTVDQTRDFIAWNILFDVLEQRMQRGNFTVIDATTLTEDQFNRYKKLIERYKYRALIVDFTDMPIEEIKKQNAERANTVGYVPEWAIDRLYTRWENTEEFIKSKNFKIIKPTDFYEFDKFMSMKPLQLDEMCYKKVVFIGDIHGCWSALNNYFKDTTPNDHPDTFYIFLGDYLDRGPENVETFKHLYDWREYKNVLLLQGNHEDHWKNFIHDTVPTDAYEKIDFYKETLPQLTEAGITKKDIARLADRLGQCAYLQNKFTQILATHAGINGMIKSYEDGKKIATSFYDSYFLTKMNTYQMVHGVGGYGDVNKIAEQWEEFINVSKGQIQGGEFKFYQIFGHRNDDKLPIQVSEHVFNLEGGVSILLNEDARLRIVEYDVENDIMTPVEVMNPKWNIGYENTPNPHTALIKDRMIRAKSLINVKRLHDNVCAFNFSHDAWYSQGWNSLTCTARGLFIDVEKNEVIARSYDKFFNYKERRETKDLDQMLKHIKYPVSVYEKYNGLLGILSTYNGELLFCSKSEDHLSTYKSDSNYIPPLSKKIEYAIKDGLRAIIPKEKQEELKHWFDEHEYYSMSRIVNKHLIDHRQPSNCMALLFKENFEKLVPVETQEKIKKFLLEKNCSMLFEVIDPERDPHIVMYDKPRVVLLDIVYNDIEKPATLFSYKNLQNLNNGVFHLDLKEQVDVIKDEEQFRKFIQAFYELTKVNKEGYVCKDADGFMLKFKTADYKFWKSVRTMLDSINNSEYGAVPTFNHTCQYLPAEFEPIVVNYYREVFDMMLKCLLEKFGEKRRDERVILPPGFLIKPDGSRYNLIEIRKMVEKYIDDSMR